MKTGSIPAIIPIAEGLYLRPAVVTDAPSLYWLIDKQRPYLRQWLPFIDASQEVSDTEIFLQYVTAKGNTQDKVFVIMYQHEVSGLISFKAIDYQHRKLEIGYYLSEQQQGKGIMRRSCQALVNYAFERMGMNRIQIKVGVGNFRSSNIPKKLGFRMEGVQREAEFLNGQFHNLEVYSLLQREWQQQ